MPALITGAVTLGRDEPGGRAWLAARLTDGHALLYATGFAISAATQPDLPYDLFKDFVGVAQIGHGTQVLSVAPALVNLIVSLFACTSNVRGKRV